MNWLDTIETEELKEVLVEQRFQITDLSSLNWALRKLSTLEKSHSEDLALCNAEIDRIAKWYEKQDSSYQSTRQYFEGIIGQYAKAQIAEDPKWKGNKTPYGKVNFHKQKDQWEYDDEVLVAYLEGERKTALLKVKMEPIKDLIKDYYTLKNGRLINGNTGELVPGVIVSEREPKLSIKLEA